MSTHSRIRSPLGGALAAGVFLLLAASGPAHAQTEGMQNRGDARDTRQTGREAARDAKQDCKENDSRAECRQQKRDTKQDTRENARDTRQGD